MTEQSARFHAVNTVAEWDESSSAGNMPKRSMTEVYGELTFNDRVMRDRLPKDIYKEVKSTIDQGTTLNPDVADAVAAAIKAWAIEHGATHYTHWFQPLTGSTAEKHDSFIKPDGEGGVIT